MRVDFIQFYSPESGYTVLRGEEHIEGNEVTVVGEMPPIHEGENLRFHGQWTSHARYGRQFRAKFYEAIMPSTRDGLEEFLSSGFIKGIGPVTAQRIIKHFGDATLEVFDKQPERLLEVPLIGARKRDQIIKSWQEHRGMHHIVMFLQQHGIAGSYGPKLYREYGEQTLHMLQTQPYDLTRIWGIGFDTADRFARKVAEESLTGWQANNLGRLKAGLTHVLKQANRDGHMYLPLAELLDRGAQLLEVEATELVPALESLIQLQELRPEPLVAPDGTEQDGAYDVYLSLNWRAEALSAERLGELMAETDSPDPEAFEQWLDEYQQEHALQFASGQREAVWQAACSKVFILTGGPGTGKTTISKAILHWFRSQKMKVRLASPTGRAAKRLSEVTGYEAMTIHRLLEFDPHHKLFQKNEAEPLECDVLMLDEISMVDMQLFSHVLRALTQNCRLILIGDSDQLPSVGAGAVLDELLQSACIPSVELSEIYRQAQSSRIVQNAHAVNHGQLPQLLPPTGRNRNEDAFYMAAHGPDQIVQNLLDLVARRLPAAGYKSEDIQVLCPMKRGPIGTQALNEALQDALNPARPDVPELKAGHRSFRLGDRVMQLKNNYDHEIFNGDLGEITRVNRQSRSLVVQFSDKRVEIEQDNLKELDLAYALTIHKSQGAEFPVVVLTLSRQHYIMLQRNLLYTGMTRAQKLLVLMGENSAIQRAVENDRLRHRYTRLGERLQRLRQEQNEKSISSNDQEN